MTNEKRRYGRRAMLKTAAGLAAMDLLAGRATAAEAARKAVTGATGKAGDFDFLAGEWRIAHRRRKSATDETWDEFAGEATCWSVLSGAGSIEELRIPERKFFGLGIRLLDVERKLWSDYWVNARSGVLSVPGQTGVFNDGAGVFTADDEDNGAPIKVRGVWDEITASSCRWTQAISRDGGRTWREDWVMRWLRK